MQYVIDHTEPKWQLRYQSHGRENGAATYSRELVKYQVPLWQRDGLDILISTCPLLETVDDLPDEVDVVVQYLHTYPYTMPLKLVNHTIRDIKVKYKKLVFVTAYHSYHMLMKANGIDSIYVPMTVDVPEVVKLKKSGLYKQDKSVIYFGNVVDEKLAVYNRVKYAFIKEGWKFDTISFNRFNGKPIQQQDAWEIVQSYDYGVGVGRCALEMQALGLKTMIAGMEFAGIMTNDADYDVQLRTNMNGRVVTFDRSVNTCIASFEQAISRTSNIHDELPRIKQAIDEYLQLV